MALFDSNLADRRARTLVIAEAGVNHNGDPDLACQLVDAAAAAGADVVKFQTFRAERLVTPAAGKADYQKVVTTAEESQFEMLRRLELSDEMHEILLARCREREIEFLSTAFDVDSLDFLMRLGQGRIKVPSGEITNLPYLRKVAGYGKPVILSTGMATLGEVEAALAVLEQGGMPRGGIVVLHCSTEYPAPMCEVNLRAMVAIRGAFGVETGYSDHTDGIEVAVAAVALGATVIEKHLTLDRGLPGPDHRASLEPHEFARMVKSIRNIEGAMGDGIKRPGASEIRNRSVARRSLVAARRIELGERFSEVNLAVKRPGTGISPMRIDEVIGRSSPRVFEVDEPIEL